MKDNNLFQKYGFLTNGFNRQYVSHVNERKYDFENTTPNQLQILVPSQWENPKSHDVNPSLKTFNETSWLRLVEALFNYLQDKTPKAKEELLSFRTDWSKAANFSETKTIDNMVKVEDLYMSVNFTSTHSTWFIGDILKFYGVKNGYLFIHRAPIAEPKEIVDIVLQTRKEGFRKYLIDKCGKSEEKANKIISAFNVFNKILSKTTSSYYDFFLFDNTLSLSNYKSRMMLDITKYVVWSDSQIATARKYLDYYSNYCTALMKESKKHQEDFEFIVPLI